MFRSYLLSDVWICFVMPWMPDHMDAPTLSHSVASMALASPPTSQRYLPFSKIPDSASNACTSVFLTLCLFLSLFNFLFFR